VQLIHGLILQTSISIHVKPLSYESTKGPWPFHSTFQHHRHIQKQSCETPKMVTDEGFPKTKALLGAQPCNVAFLVAGPSKDVDPQDKNRKDTPQKRQEPTRQRQGHKERDAQDKTTTRQGKARQDKKRQDTTRQDETRKHKARQRLEKSKHRK
jgi:hypothetical protein